MKPRAFLYGFPNGKKHYSSCTQCRCQEMWPWVVIEWTAHHKPGNCVLSFLWLLSVVHLLCIWLVVLAEVWTALQTFFTSTFLLLCEILRSPVFCLHLRISEQKDSLDTVAQVWTRWKKWQGNLANDPGRIQNAKPKRKTIMEEVTSQQRDIPPRPFEPHILCHR